MWEQIRANKRMSAVLVVSMAAVLLALGYFLAELFAPGSGLFGLLIASVVWLFLSLISYFGGDNIFLTLAGARKIEKKDLPVLYNVVEEMTIASGLPKMPDVFIVDDSAPNAFATGRDHEHAAVAVTSGLLRICDRDELQGVVAHEIGHIKNRDTLLMLMAGVMVGAIVILADVGARALWLGGGRRTRSRRRGGGQAQLIILLVAVVLMILALIIARLIYFAVSRSREYLADASSALFTRYPEGLASALEKISSSPEKLDRATRATAPMYIINPLKREGSRPADLSSTHPPISERVRVLRSMDGVAMGDYEASYSRTSGTGRSIIPASSLEEGRDAERREPRREEDRKRRARTLNDFLWRVHNYLFLACACGTVLKIPPDFRAGEVKCPHCGRSHSAKEFTRPSAEGAEPAG